MTDERQIDIADLMGLARTRAAVGPIWTNQSEDLNVNLLALAAEGGIPVHVNAEVDVLPIGVTGADIVELDGTAHAVGPGHALIIPKGARRAIRGSGGRFAYTTCHRRRAGLWPRGVPRPCERPNASSGDVR